MKYSLSLNKTGRILSVTFAKYKPDGILVKTLPDGDITDYKFIDGQFVYDPLPKPKEPKPVPSLQEQIDDINLVLADIFGGAL